MGTNVMLLARYHPNNSLFLLPFNNLKSGETLTYGTRETLTYGIGESLTPFEVQEAIYSLFNVPTIFFRQMLHAGMMMPRLTTTSSIRNTAKDMIRK